MSELCGAVTEHSCHAVTSLSSNGLAEDASSAFAGSEGTFEGIARFSQMSSVLGEIGAMRTIVH